MSSPGRTGLEDLVDAVDPVVDAAPFESVEAYRSAIVEVRAATRTTRLLRIEVRHAFDP